MVIIFISIQLQQDVAKMLNCVHPLSSQSNPNKRWPWCSTGNFPLSICPISLHVVDFYGWGPRPVILSHFPGILFNPGRGSKRNFSIVITFLHGWLDITQLMMIVMFNPIDCKVTNQKSSFFSTYICILVCVCTYFFKMCVYLSPSW